MQKIIITSLAIALTAAPFAAFAQTGAVVATPPNSMVIGQPGATGTVLPAGTTVRLRTLSELNSQDSRTGQRFDLEVADDVMLNGMVVIPRGSPAYGEVTLAKKKGMWGKSGKLETRLISIRANGRDIPIRGSVGDKGQTGTAGVVGAIVVLPLAGFFVTGTSASLPSGTSASAQTESDIPVVFAANR